jgi:hypothetical protein
MMAILGAQRYCQLIEVILWLKKPEFKSKRRDDKTENIEEFLMG